MRVKIPKMSARQIAIVLMAFEKLRAFLVKNQLSKVHMITSRKTDLLCNFCTEFIVYYMIMVYKKNLAQEWLLGVFLQFLVLG